MSFRIGLLGSLALVFAPAGCTEDGPADDGSNPFLEDQRNLGKEDTGYLNPDGIEVEVDIEADVDVGTSTYRIWDAPADVGQFALTYLRKNGEFYLESLAEDSNSSDRVEWQVEGVWLTTEQAREGDPARLRHFRIRGMNAVLLFGAATGATEGSVFTAKVPVKPYTVMTDAGSACADPDSHMGLDQSIYWYMWNPSLGGCTLATQDARITISRMLRSDGASYPEYDRLAADNVITAVILFGQIGDGAITSSDPGMTAFRQMGTWLKNAGFGEATTAPVGKRYTKGIGSINVIVDLYSPNDFSGLGDTAHFSNFQRALGEHEIVVYDGHSMLGASDFWSRPTYPDFYQVFLYGGCLGYEYYLRPILAGKGGWENVDIVSSVVEVSANANEFAGPFLAKLFWSIEHDWAASWKDMLIAIRRRVGDSTFGASGVRDNCFSPGGSLCTPTPDPGTARTYENTTDVAIPDDDATGVTSVIEVPDALDARTVTLDLAISHTWVGDLRVTLGHGGTESVVWDRGGGSTHDIRRTFALDAFAGSPAAGTWTLSIADLAGEDTGTLERWALVIEP